MADSLLTVNKLGYIDSGSMSSRNNFFHIHNDGSKKGDTHLCLPQHVVEIVVNAIVACENYHLYLPGRDPIWFEFNQPEEVTLLWNSIYTDDYYTATFEIVDILNYLNPDSVRTYLQTTPKG